GAAWGGRALGGGRAEGAPGAAAARGCSAKNGSDFTGPRIGGICGAAGAALFSASRTTGAGAPARPTAFICDVDGRLTGPPDGTGAIRIFAPPDAGPAAEGGGAFAGAAGG